MNSFNLNITFLYEVLVFVLLFYFLATKVIPIIADQIKSRNQYINAELAKAQQAEVLSQEAKKLLIQEQANCINLRLQQTQDLQLHLQNLEQKAISDLDSKLAFRRKQILNNHQQMLSKLTDDKSQEITNLVLSIVSELKPDITQISPDEAEQLKQRIYDKFQN